MAESALSAEVNGVTVLPSPTIGTVSVDSDGNVVVPWTNNDDSPDGGIDVERSTDGFASVTTVVSGLAPSTTSYTDTSVSGGTTYEYRIERSTDHASATSGASDPFRVPKQLTRAATMTENGATATATRDPITKTRAALMTENGATATATRDPITKTRAAVMTENGATATATRVTSKTRAALMTENGATAIATRDPITKARAALSRAAGSDMLSGRVFIDVLGDGLGFYEVEYDATKNAHVTEWIYEKPVNEARDFGVRLQSAVETGRIDIAVERDDTGDGTVDARSEYITTTADDVPTHVPDIANGAAYYRVLLYGPHVYPDDHLRGLDVGFIH